MQNRLQSAAKSLESSASRWHRTNKLKSLVKVDLNLDSEILMAVTWRHRQQTAGASNEIRQFVIVCLAKHHAMVTDAFNKP